jgi:hypothetical protein
MLIYLGEPSTLAAGAKPVTIRFARQNAKRMKLQQSKSLANQQKLKDEEPWCEVDFFTSNDIRSIVRVSF